MNSIEHFFFSLTMSAIQNLVSNLVFSLIWLGFMANLTIVGYLMPNPLYTYLFNIYDLVWLGIMAYQPLFVIYWQILFLHIY